MLFEDGGICGGRATRHCVGDDARRPGVGSVVRAAPTAGLNLVPNRVCTLANDGWPRVLASAYAELDAEPRVSFIRGARGRYSTLQARSDADAELKQRKEKGACVGVRVPANLNILQAHLSNRAH